MANQKWMKRFIGFLLMMNGAFISLALYKEHIRDQWMDQQVAAEKAFNTLNQLNNWTLLIESTLSFAMIIIAIWLMIKKNNAVNRFIFINMMACLFFLVIGLLLAMVFDTADFNLIQQLLGPIFILIVLGICQIMKKLLSKFVVVQN